MGFKVVRQGLQRLLYAMLQMLQIQRSSACLRVARQTLRHRVLHPVITMSTSAQPAALTVQPSMTLEASIARFKRTVPPLDGTNYKGQHGKVAVVGGCTAYTGAPYYAAQAAHKVGADLTYVLCTRGAAPIIKGFSPDMIVLPTLAEHEVLAAACARVLTWRQDDRPVEAKQVEQQLQEAKRWLPRMTVLVLGPGLGEGSGPQQAAAQLIRWAREAQIPIVIDGSAISTVAADPSLIQGYKRCVLTPNMAELGRLAGAVQTFLPGNIGSHWQEHAQQVAAAWDGPILVSKGPKDVITDGRTSLFCAEPGSLKRCGGIGDVLAGTTGVFLGWQYGRHTSSEPASEDLMVACQAACTLLRRASLVAFNTHGRAMSAADILPALPREFVTLFGP